MPMTDSAQGKPGELPGDEPRGDVDSLSEHIDQNIESVVALQRREWESVSLSQRRVERVSRFIGRPSYLI